MKGFFTKEETQSVLRPDGKIYSCVRCNLIKTANTPKMKPHGNFKKGILIVNNYPVKRDDAVGKPLQSKDGLLLEKHLEKLGIDIWEDCIVTNAVNCCPSGDGPPSSYQYACCRMSLLKTIDEYLPKLIILLGEGPLISLIGHRWKKDLGNINKWRGWVIPDQDLKCWIAPIYHPSEVREGKQEINTIFQQDLERAINMGLGPFRKQPAVQIDIIGEDDLKVLYDIKNGDLSAIDFETTGLKPHAAGHRIISAAITTSPTHVYAFMLPKRKSKRRPIIDYLTNKTIQKIAQNLKYEDVWSAVRLNTIVQGWAWDTMMATHILDNRSGISSLKFQTYVQFGVIDYDSDVSPYLKSDEESNGNGINHIHDLIATEEGARKLLTYNGYDSLFEHQLAILQTDIMNYDFLPF